jgi:voltage-gated potassium channel Kch
VLLVYQHLEGLRWQDALFWIVNPHAIEYRRVRDATKFFSIFVYFGVFAFQTWVAERLLITVINRQSVEGLWSTTSALTNFAITSSSAVRTNCGGSAHPPGDSFRAHRNSESLCRELLKDKGLAIQGDAKRHDILHAGIERARGVCIGIDNDSDNLYITVTAKALNSKARIITRAGQARYAQAMRNSGADEVIIPEYEGGLMTGRMIAKYYPVLTNLE